MYFEGKLESIPKQNIDWAIDFWEMASAQGYTPSILSLAKIYEFGHGFKIPIDRSLALSYYQKIVEAKDGSYLAESFIESGIKVFGTIRKNSFSLNPVLEKFRNLGDNKIEILQADLLDFLSLYKVISSVKPTHIFNEADQDSVTWSGVIPNYSLATTVAGPLNIFEIVRELNPEIRIFQPLSSNMYGNTEQEMLNESAELRPISHYGVYKSACFHNVKMYREVHKLRISAGIFFNHESPRRSVEYLSRKVTRGVAAIKLGMQNKIQL